jgi:hypothetical protein
MNIQTFNQVYNFYTNFREVPFGSKSKISFPPGEKLSLDGLLVPHIAALTHLRNDTYWNDEWWGYSPEDTKMIDLDKIQKVKYVRKGSRDYSDWLAVLEVKLNGEKIYLFLQARCCYTGFGVCGGVFIYASKSLHALRKMCMTASEEYIAFG